MDGFERRRQKKKEDILKAAFDLFKQFGYSKVSIAEIAKKAGVSQVSIYNFFESKEKLRDTLTGKLMDEHIQRVIDILDSGVSLKVIMEKTMQVRLDYFKNFSQYLSMSMIPEGDFFKKYMYGEKYQKAIAMTMEAFEKAKEEGVIAEGITMEILDLYIDMMRSYFVNHPELLFKFDSDPKFVEGFYDFFYRGFIKN